MYPHKMDKRDIRRFYGDLFVIDCDPMAKDSLALFISDIDYLPLEYEYAYRKTMYLFDLLTQLGVLKQENVGDIITSLKRGLHG